MYKTHHSRTTFGRVAGARDSACCQKWAKREGFVAVATTTTTLHYTTLHYNYNYNRNRNYNCNYDYNYDYNYNYTTLHYATLH